MRSFFRGQHYLPARLWREITAPAAAAVTLLHAAWIAAWECRASVRIRSCARGLTSCISSFRKQSRAGNQIGRVFLQRCFGKTGAQNAELNWNGDLFFHGDADADDQVGGNFSVRTDAEISAGVVGRQAACEAGIAKLCQTRQEGGTACARHAEFKEISKYQRMGRTCDIDFSTAGHAAFPPAAVADAKIQIDNDVSPHPDILCTEDRCTASFFITV